MIFCTSTKATLYLFSINTKKQSMLRQSNRTGTRRCLFMFFSTNLSLVELNQHEEAIKCYDKAIELDPNYIKAYHKKGLLLMQLNNTRSNQCFDKTIDLDLKHPYAYFNKAYPSRTQSTRRSNQVF